MDESRFQVFDAAAFLDSEEAWAAYISEAMREPDPDRLSAALATVARARGMKLSDTASATTTIREEGER